MQIVKGNAEYKWTGVYFQWTLMHTWEYGVSWNTHFSVMHILAESIGGFPKRQYCQSDTKHTHQNLVEIRYYFDQRLRAPWEFTKIILTHINICYKAVGDNLISPFFI